MSRLARFVRSTFGHFLDRGAAPRKSERFVADSIQVVLSTAFAVLAAVPTLFSGPFSTRLVLILIALVALCALGGSLALVTATDQSRGRYEHPQAIRNPAKIAFIFLVGLFGIASYRALPNGLVGTTMLSGHICSASSDAPVNGAAVEVLDRADQPISIRAERTGDDGFFFHDLSWGAQAPASIRVHAPGCPAQTLAIAGSILSDEGCGSFGDGEIEARPSARKWSISCPAR